MENINITNKTHTACFNANKVVSERGHLDKTWRFWKGGGTRQCHQMTRGGGREFAKVSHDIFSKKKLALFLHFDLLMLMLITLFFGKLKCHVKFGGGGGLSNVRKWHIGRGPKINLETESNCNWISWGDTAWHVRNFPFQEMK